MNSLVLRLGSQLCYRQRAFGTSAFACMDWKSIKEKQLRNPTIYGPLTILPDYSFMDGRPVPVGSNLRKRLQKQRQIAEKIVKYCKQIDYAVERHTRLQDEEANRRKQIIKNKLTSKGNKKLQ